MALRVLDTTVSLASQDRLHRLDQSLLRHRQLLLDQQATGAASSTNFAQPKPTDSTDISPVLRFFQEHARLNPMRLGKYMEDCLQYSFAQIPELGCREVSRGSVIDGVNGPLAGSQCRLMLVGAFQTGGSSCG